MLGPKHLALVAALALAGSAAESQPRPASPIGAPAQPAMLTYADIADLALPAPIVAHVRIRRAIPVAGDTARQGGRARLYVEADIVSLIKGPQAPSRIAYLADVLVDARGRPERLRKRSEQLIFARPVPGRPGELQLLAGDAWQPFDPALAERTRAVLRAAAAADAAPAITGIGRAFHVPGTLAGESETQFFLLAEGGRPISVTVLRRPGERPRWAVALGEIVDEAAAEPRRDTLLWYRLACSLPEALPAASMVDAEPAHHAAIRADYRLIREGLGSCQRTRRTG